MTLKAVSHTLKVKCPTWDHVESFYARKVKEGNSLSARVPFQAELGEVITLALELPDLLVIAIDGEVVEVAPAPDGKKSSVRLSLMGLSPTVRGRLEALVMEARRRRTPTGMRRILREEPLEPGQPPAPQPIDAPVDEVIAPVLLPREEDVSERERPVYRELVGQLRSMRDSAANEVLGVKWDAPVDDIRRSYFGLTRRLHPDVLARHRSAAIQLLAGEIFIQVNRAYDRMRDAAVASGRAIAPGPALLAHRGWMAEFDDIGTQAKPSAAATAVISSARTPAPVLKAPTPAKTPPPSKTQTPSKTPTPVPFTDEALFGDPASRGATPPPAPVADSPAVDPAQALARSRELLAAKEFGPARELLAGALRAEPRNRTARALYHLASAEALLVDGKPVEATTQLEVAMAHDPACEEVRAALARLRQDPPKGRTGLFRRLFR